MEIQYHITQNRGCYIVMPVFSADTSDTFPARRIAAMNDFYTFMEKNICAYAASLCEDLPHSRYSCVGEACCEENGCLTVQFRLFRRTPGQQSASRTIRHIWQKGLLLRQITDR